MESLTEFNRIFSELLISIDGHQYDSNFINAETSQIDIECSISTYEYVVKSGKRYGWLLSHPMEAAFHAAIEAGEPNELTLTFFKPERS